MRPWRCRCRPTACDASCAAVRNDWSSHSGKVVRSRTTLPNLRKRSCTKAALRLGWRQKCERYWLARLAHAGARLRTQVGERATFDGRDDTHRRHDVVE